MKFNLSHVAKQDSSSQGWPKSRTVIWFQLPPTLPRMYKTGTLRRVKEWYTKKNVAFSLDRAVDGCGEDRRLIAGRSDDTLVTPSRRAV